MSLHLLNNQKFSLVPSVGQSILSLDEFTFIRTITIKLLRSLEETVQKGCSVLNQTIDHHLDVDHISLMSMKPGESVSLMYCMALSDFLTDWETHIDDIGHHVLTDASRLQCRMQNHNASPDDILQYAAEWPTNSLDQKLIYAAGTATCIGAITQMVSFGLLHEDMLLCEPTNCQKATTLSRQHFNPLRTKIYQKSDSTNKKIVLFDAIKVLSCCKITSNGAMEYGTCSMHIFRDPENLDQMIFIADVMRVPNSWLRASIGSLYDQPGSHDILSPLSVCSLSEIMFEYIQENTK